MYICIHTCLCTNTYICACTYICSCIMLSGLFPLEFASWEFRVCILKTFIYGSIFFIYCEYLWICIYVYTIVTWFFFFCLLNSCVPEFRVCVLSTCLCVCICTCVCVYTHTCVHSVYISSDVRMQMHMYWFTYTHAGTHPVYACMHVRLAHRCMTRPWPPMQQDGATPLYIAAEKGHTESITLLLQGGAAVDAKLEVRGALLSLMSRALALLLSLSSLALFLGFISSIHAYVGSRLWGVVITGPFINFLLHNHFITHKFQKKNPAKQKTAQFVPFFFCFIRELNPHPLLTFSLYPPIRPYLTHHPSALEPLGSIKPWF